MIPSTRGASSEAGVLELRRSCRVSAPQIVRSASCASACGACAATAHRLVECPTRDRQELAARISHRAQSLLRDGDRRCCPSSSGVTMRALTRINPQSLTQSSGRLCVCGGCACTLRHPAELHRLLSGSALPALPCAPHLSSESAMPAAEAYNVFCRKREPGLCCAVPQGRPVPSFIQDEVWAFRGTVRTADPYLKDFQSEVAREASRLSGYYLFHALQS